MPISGAFLQQVLWLQVTLLSGVTALQVCILKVFLKVDNPLSHLN